MQLKKCSLELQAITFIQCIRDDLFHDGDDQRNWDSSYQIASVDFSERIEKAPPIAEQFDLGNFMRLKIAASLKPTFKTFNISRCYRLRLKLSVQCAQKTFKLEFPPSDFEVLARDYIPIGEGNVPLSDIVHGFEAAPVYNDTLGPPPKYRDSNAS